MRSAVVAAVLLAVVPPAHGGETWASTDDAPARADKAEAYEEAMAAGDDAVISAAGGGSTRFVEKRALAAVEAYERAAKLRPDDPEPHWRAANVLFGFFLDCDVKASPLCVDETAQRARFEKIARRAIAHWNAVEKKDPLDPRMLPGPRNAGIRFERALLHTKLATDDDLRAAVRDYEAVLETAPAVTSDFANAVGNLAEAHMMLGDLDAAIERYREAAQMKSNTSITYGLAVAYDRDGQGAKAREMIRALGVEGFRSWAEDVADGGTFYVPAGEVHYYYALAYEALGADQKAARQWREFIASGAHPRYQPRAQENLAAAEKRIASTKK